MYLIELLDMKTRGGMEVQLHALLSSNLGESEWDSFTPRSFYSRELSPCTNRIEGCVGPWAGLDVVEKRRMISLSRIDPQFLGHPVRNLVALWTPF
jgi:hypothetical protein